LRWHGRQAESSADLRIARVTYLAMLVLTVLWLLALPLPAWLIHRGQTTLALFLYEGFSVACHQISARSYQFLGFPLAVCSRCVGIYLGVLVGLLTYPLVRPLGLRRPPARHWLFLAAVPIVVDFGGGFVGFWVNTFLSRTLTGGIAGIGAIFFFFPAVVDVVDDWRSGEHRGPSPLLRPDETVASPPARLQGSTTETGLPVGARSLKVELDSSTGIKEHRNVGRS